MTMVTGDCRAVCVWRRKENRAGVVDHINIYQPDHDRSIYDANSDYIKIISLMSKTQYAYV
jgi:hypothetical protein